MPRPNPVGRPRRNAVRPAVLDLLAEVEIEPEDDTESDEDYFLSQLRAAVARARNPAEDVFDQYYGSRAGALDRIYADFGL